MAGGKVLSASYVLDAASLSPGIAQADAELGGLDASAADLSSKVDGHTAAMGAAFSDLGAGIGADVGAGVEDAKGRMGDLDDAGKNLESDFDSHTSKIGSMFKGLGESAGNFGLPFTSGLTKMGEKLDDAKSKGQGFKQVMSDIGGVTVVAGAAGLAAVSVEAVKMADNFDVAQAQLQNAVKNSGESFKSLQPSINATYGSMAKLGFNSTDVAGALTSLVTSTGNTKKAEEDLGTAADLARAKHISLSDATGILTKTLAGSTRGLTTLGLNLDIGSGKLKTIATDTAAYKTAQGNLHLVDQQVADGTLKGAAAYSALLTAHEAVDKSSQKLQLDQGTIAKIFDTVKQKTQGAADAYGNTLSGQMAVAGAETHNLGTAFGDELIPMLTDALNVVEESVGWLQKHEAVAEALGVTIGTFLAGAVAVFTVNMVSGMIASVKSALTSIGLLSGATEEQTVVTGEATAAVEQQSTANTAQASSIDQLIAALEGLTEALTPAAAAETEATTNAAQLSLALEEVGANATAAAGEMGEYDAAVSTAGAQSVAAAGQMDILGASAEGAGTKMEIAGAAAGEGGMAEDLGAAGVGAGGLAAALLPLAAVLTPIAMGAYAVTHANDGLKVSLQGSAAVAVDMTANTLPQMTVKMDALQKVQDGLSQKIAQGGLTAQVAQQAYQEVHTQVDDLRTAQTNLTNNLTILASNFGISTTQAQGLAQAAGINLQKALDPAQVSAFAMEVQQSGLQMDTTGQKAQNMSATTVAAMSSMVAALKSTGTAADWGQLGQMIDFGIGNGITENQGVVINSAQGMVQAVISASKTGLKAASPSQVFVDLGQTIPQGLAVGVGMQAHLANEAVTSLVGGMIGSVPSSIGTSPVPTGAGAGIAGEDGAPGAGAPSAGAGATTAPTQVVLNITVQGSVLTDQNLTDAVWQGLLQKGLVNGSGGQLVFTA